MNDTHSQSLTNHITFILCTQTCTILSPRLGLQHLRPKPNNERNNSKCNCHHINGHNQKQAGVARFATTISYACPTNRVCFSTPTARKSKPTPQYNARINTIWECKHTGAATLRTMGRATGLLPFTNFATGGAGKSRDSTGTRFLTQALSRGWLAHKLMLEQGGVGLFI